MHSIPTVRSINNEFFEVFNVVKHTAPVTMYGDARRKRGVDGSTDNGRGPTLPQRSSSLGNRIPYFPIGLRSHNDDQLLPLSQQRARFAARRRCSDLFDQKQYDFTPTPPTVFERLNRVINPVRKTVAESVFRTQSRWSREIGFLHDTRRIIGRRGW